MWSMVKRIVATGRVTEGWQEGAVPPAFRGKLMLHRGMCSSCGDCVATCPVGAISMSEGYPVIEDIRCIFCGRCMESCNEKALLHGSKYDLSCLRGEQLGGTLAVHIRRLLGRSLAIRHVDVGSCNACDWEMAALSNPVYDIQQYGIDFVASPRHADMLMVTGVVTRNLTQALLMTYEATPTPKMVMAVGSCACSGATYASSYAIRGKVDEIVPVDVYVPGCPPRPQAFLHGLLLALGKL